MKKGIYAEMVDFKRILFLVAFSIHITIQQRPNKDFLEAVIKEFKMKSPHFVSPSINHGFVLAKNTMEKKDFSGKLSTRLLASDK